MSLAFRRWWNTPPVLENPIEQQQAPSLRLFLIALVVAATLWMPLPLLIGTNMVGLILSISAALLVVISNLVGLVLLGRGQFRVTVLLSATALTIGASIVLWLWGLRSAAGFVVVFTISLTMTGLLASWRSMVITALFCIGVVGAAAVAESAFPRTIGFAPFKGNPNILSAGTFVLAISVLTALFLQFGVALRRLYQQALDREQELEGLHASLTTTVTELQTALQTVELREAQLQHTLTDLRTSEEIVRDLSAPVIPVLPGVLVAPLVGAIDSARAVILMDNILHTVETTRAVVVVFDITGVPVVDSQVAHVLLNTTEAIRLLGAQVVLVGIRPEVAQSLVALGVSLESIAVHADLQEAVMRLIPQLRNPLITSASATNHAHRFNGADQPRSS